MQLEIKDIVLFDCVKKQININNEVNIYINFSLLLNGERMKKNILNRMKKEEKFKKYVYGIIVDFIVLNFEKMKDYKTNKEQDNYFEVYLTGNALKFEFNLKNIESKAYIVDKTIYFLDYFFNSNSSRAKAYI